MSSLLTSPLPGLHPDQADYVSIRRTRGLYVDKTPAFTQLLARAPHSDPRDPDLQVPYVFLTRPRRFGKSLLVATLEAWFQGVPADLGSPDHHDVWPDWLFAGTAGFETWRSQTMRPVIRLDMSGVSGDSAHEVKDALLAHLGRIYVLWAQRGVRLPSTGIAWDCLDGVPLDAVLDDRQTPHFWLESLIRRLYAHYGQKPVVLIDEYNAPITRLIGKRQADREACEDILDLLHDFYQVLKRMESRMHFVFLTGISFLGKVSVFSALNNLVDISLDERYNALCGFTEAEVTACLTPYLERIAHNIGGSLATVRETVRDYYNGYQFSPYLAGADPVYNPFTLLSCLHDWQHRQTDQAWPSGLQANHWARSGNPSLLIRLVGQGQYQAPPVRPDVSRLSEVSYDLAQLDYASLMFQTGYYTFRGGTPEEPLRLDYPNREVRETYMRHLQGYLDGRGQAWPAQAHVARLYQALAAQAYEQWVAEVETLLAGIPGDKLQAESDFHLVLDVMSYMLHTAYGTELSGWGTRLDQAHVFADHVCVMELKYNRTAAEALAQIERKGYIRRYQSRGVPIVGLGLNFHKSGAGTPGIEYVQRTLYEPDRPARHPS